MSTHASSFLKDKATLGVKGMTLNEDDEVILHELFIKWIESYGDIMVKGTSPMDSKVFQEL